MHYLNATALVGVAIALAVSGALYRQHILSKITQFGTAVMSLCIIFSVFHIVEMLVRLDDPTMIGAPLANGILTTLYGAVVLFICHGVHAAGLGVGASEGPAEET